MPYTTRDATRTLFGYLGLNETEVEFIPETSNAAQPSLPGKGSGRYIQKHM